MRTTMLLVLLLMITLGVSAQQNDTTKIEMKNKTILIINKGSGNIDLQADSAANSIETIIVDGEEPEDDDDDEKFNSHWFGFDLGLNGYFTPDGSTTLPAGYEFLDLKQPKSLSFALNLIEVNIPIVEKRMGITTGLGFVFNNYRFSKNINLVDDSAKIQAYTDTLRNYTKNKLLVTTLRVPVLLEFQIPVGDDDDNFHFAVGGYGGLRIGSHTKQVYEVNGNEFKEKKREDYHLSPFNYGLTARVGYNNLGVFVDYSLSSLFEDNQGPELNPWSAGISFAF